jgi:hypothetical protein
VDKHKIIEVTKEEWLSELLQAMWKRMGIENIEDEDDTA